MSAPQRIQRKRTKGWKMPANTVYVGRPSQWGNPYSAEQWGGSVSEAVSAYERYVLANQGSAERFRMPLHELKGKNLSCWCTLDQLCHADVLLRIANQERP
jgi:uncharacterized protein DUF4326